jgi:hypothetical protein
VEGGIVVGHIYFCIWWLFITKEAPSKVFLEHFKGHLLLLLKRPFTKVICDLTEITTINKHVGI